MSDMEVTNPSIETPVRGLVDWVGSQETSTATALSARWTMNLLQEVVSQVSTLRIAAVPAQPLPDGTIHRSYAPVDGDAPHVPEWALHARVGG